MMGRAVSVDFTTQMWGLGLCQSLGSENEMRARDPTFWPLDKKRGPLHSLYGKSAVL